MRKTSVFIALLAVSQFILSSLTASAAEPVQPLLAELIRPNASLLASVSPLSTIPADELAADAAADFSEVADLFSLEELHEKSAAADDLTLPDLALPISDIPLTLNSKVEYFLYSFQTGGRPSFARWLSRSSRYIPMMKEVLKREGMPEDLVYVAMIESGFQLHARSWANAVGPWQFISETGRRYALRIDQWIDERKDPVKATTAAALYMRELYGMFKGDWYLAAAGYNAGENKILRAITMYNSSDFWEISRGAYLKRETKEYVPKLLAAAIIAKDPARYGFNDIAYLNPVEFDTVGIPSRTDLEVASRICGTTYETIKELNPDLKHWCTPPNYPDYQLKIPKGCKSEFEAEYAKIPEEQRYTEKVLYTRYHVRKRGDSLKGIARRFGTTVAALSELNSLSAKSRIAGATLLVPVKQTVNFGHEGRSARASGKENPDTYYTVKKGDTLTSLAKRFNVSSSLLSAWNNLKTKVALKPGRRIIIAKITENSGETSPAPPKS